MKSQFTVEFAGSSYPSFYLTQKSDAERAIAVMLESKEILAADTETAPLPQYRHIAEAALSPHLAKPRLVQMFTGKGAVVIDLYKTGEIESLGTLFNTRPSVFHNMNFDLKMLMKWHGVSYPDMHCTAIMARCCWQAMYPGFKSATLKDVAKALFKEDVIKQAGASDWSMPELTYEQVYYAAKDAVIQRVIYDKLSQWLEKLNLTKCYEVYRKAQIVLSQMELNGILVDKDAHRKNIVTWRQAMADARDEVERITGLRSITDSKISEWLKKNLEADLLAVWPKTESSKENDSLENQQLAVNSDALVNFSHLEIVKPFSEFQKYKKLCTAFGTSLLEQVNPATGKIHSGYTVCGARTGRASCSNPNFQNMPRDPKMRGVFTASPGYEMMVSDFSQIEVRIFAEYSREEKMLIAFERGLDIYKHTAALLLNKKYEDVTKKERTHVKPLVLGLAYGLGSSKYGHYAKKNYGVSLTLEESHDLVQQYRELYDHLYAWQLQQPAKCEASNYTCFAALGKSNKLSEDKYWGASMNHPIQSAAATIMYLALIFCEKALRGTSVKFLGTVHDEMIIEYKKEERNHVKKILTEQSIKAYHVIMQSERTLVNLVDPLWGDNWAEAKDEDRVRE